MNEQNEIQKICPSCNQLNRGDNNYCRFCGASLEGAESTELERAPVSDGFETNKVEIKRNYWGLKYVGNFFLFLIPIFFIALTIFAIYYADVLSSFAVFLISCFIVPLCIIGLIKSLIITASYGKTREFSISDQRIKINIRKKYAFQIDWSQFDTIKVYQTIGRPIGMSTSADNYNFHFFSKNQLVGNLVIETPTEFMKGDFKRINSLIQQYAQKLNKLYGRIKLSGIEKMKRSLEIPPPSTPAIQTIPEASNQMSVSQSQQIDLSIVCPYCGNTDLKKKKMKLIKVLGVYFIAFLIFAFLFTIFFNSPVVYSSFPLFNVFFLITLICVISNTANCIRKRDIVECPQCKKEYNTKKS